MGGGGGGGGKDVKMGKVKGGKAQSRIQTTDLKLGGPVPY